jgi:hypothetical protein
VPLKALSKKQGWTSKTGGPKCLTIKCKEEFKIQIKKYLVSLSLTFFLLAGFMSNSSLPAEKEIIYAYNMYNLGRASLIDQIMQNVDDTNGLAPIKSQKRPDYFAIF